LAYSLDLARKLDAGRIVVVAGHQAEEVRRAFPPEGGLRYVLQEPQLGTGHAVMAAAPELADWPGPVLILCGDVPGLSATTARGLLEQHLARAEALTVLAMDLADPGAYGRLVTGPEGGLVRIVEHRDATERQRAITLVNAGVYAARAEPLLGLLPRLAADNDQKEYYLTDLVELMAAEGLKVGYSVCSNPEEVAGVNSREELAALEEKMAGRG
jgi:bifunctional N-acetylglucosamine-1-phosphate-uridyltransferase/glucosamine-1-phosphate-acetyltransferase GlmU-like protein